MPSFTLRRTRSFPWWTQWLFLTLGFALLGYVGLSLLDSRLFQARENWRLNQALNNSHRSAGTIQSRPVAKPPLEKVHRNQPAPGTLIGRIEIESIGVATVVLEGTDRRTLQRAVGHISGTALPGEQGNLAIAGHRDTFFRSLGSVHKDDEITLTTLEGSFRYRVDSTRIVASDEIDVLNDSDESILTLVTCYPFYFVGPAPKRFVVRAHLDRTGTDLERENR